MEVIRFDFDEKIESKGPICLALGTFDGFHRGHQEVIIKTRKKAKNIAGVLLFSNHPKTVLRDESYPILMDVEDKILMADKLGIDVCYVVSGSKEFFNLGVDGFMDLLSDKIGADQLVVGADFRFGKGGVGTPEDLKKRFDVEVVDLLCVDGRKISSTSIKARLQEGDIKGANEELGHPYLLKGKVVHGFEYGRELGFPTANIELNNPYALPAKGVYFGIIYILGIPHRAVLNIGTNPTIGKLGEKSVEVHILDFHEDIYGRTAYLYLLDFHRRESKFSSPEELKQAIASDVEWARKIVY